MCVACLHYWGAERERECNVIWLSPTPSLSLSLLHLPIAFRYSHHIYPLVTPFHHTNTVFTIRLPSPFFLSCLPSFPCPECCLEITYPRTVKSMWALNCGPGLYQLSLSKCSLWCRGKGRRWWDIRRVIEAMQFSLWDRKRMKIKTLKIQKADCG